MSVPACAASRRYHVRLLQRRRRAPLPAPSSREARGQAQGQEAAAELLERRQRRRARQAPAEEARQAETKVQRKFGTTTATTVYPEEERLRASREAQGPAKKEPARKRRKSSTGSTARKPKQLTKVQRLEKALGAFEWWNAPEASTTLEHAGVTFEPQRAAAPWSKRSTCEINTAPGGARDALRVDARTGRAREGRQREDLSRSPRRRWGVRTLLGRSKVDPTRISEHLDEKTIRRSASDAEKKATKEMKDKQLLKSAASRWPRREGRECRMEPSSLFGGGASPYWSCETADRADRVAINVGAGSRAAALPRARAIVVGRAT